MVRTVLTVILAFFLTISSVPAGNAAEKERTVREVSEAQQAQVREQAEELTVHFLDVGQGDCTLITCKGAAMLIDAGDDGQGTRVQKYLMEQGVRSLDYVVCTHFDADHIGGMDVILYKFDCDRIFMTDGESDTDAYRDLAAVMEDRAYERTLPAAGEQYELGDAVFTIVGPARSHDDDNNNSVALLLTHGENTFLFTGDAGEEEERDIAKGDLSVLADVYKVGHHGSRTSTSGDLLEKISPAYAVISCGADNAYGHPHQETLDKLREMDVQVFRTDEQGTILAVSDGEKITWNCSPSDTWKTGEPGESGRPGQTADEEGEAASPENAAITYVCNRNTGKFHNPDCASVSKITEKNKLELTVTREEVTDMGYVPCRNCNP